jgi:hypothetical protein
MEDLIDQANEIQETLGRTYGVPDEVDEADLEAGKPIPISSVAHLAPSDNMRVRLQNSRPWEKTLGKKRRSRVIFVTAPLYQTLLTRPRFLHNQ